MTVWEKNYDRWVNKSDLDEALRQQLEAIADDPKQLEDSFYKELEFGTGGIRGILGPGTNRLNTYTIHKAAEGLAQYMIEHGEEAKARGVVIAYDCRHKSPEFAIEVATTLGQHGIQSYVFDALRPTPELSFAVRYLHAYAGIMITASHNPPEYNGLKMYGEDGGQVISDMADDIVAKVNTVEDELDIQTADEAELKATGLLKIIGKQIDDAYTTQLKSVVVNQSVIDDMAQDLKIVFTPIHGTGNHPVRNGLKAIGFKHVNVVKEQELPDANFTTVASPNPEHHEAFELAIEYGEKINADILLATDPDADRMGVAVKHPDGKYGVLTGNQIGALMLHYLITEKEKQHTLSDHAVVLKTIVTSELGRDIAKQHGLETIDTLTGFKYIAEQMKRFETTGKHEFLMGYEESYGYLIRDFVRDKDAVQACLLISEVAAFYKQQGMTLYEGLMAIFETYGYYQERMESIKLAGKAGAEKIDQIISAFRNHPPQSIAHQKVVTIEDYEKGERTFVLEHRKEVIDLPTSNVLKYKLANGAWVCLRPSGTEPLIKMYFGVKEETMEASRKHLIELADDVMERVKSV